MSLLLINPYPYYATGINEASLYPPLGLAYIAAFLEEHKFESKIVDANLLKLSEKKILNIISSENPRIIGISANILTSRAAIELASLIKKEFKNLLVVSGGPAPTARPELFLSSCDVVVRGEGEVTFSEIIKGRKLNRIKGISFKANDKIIHNEPRKLIKNLDRLPYPAWHLLKPDFRRYRTQTRRKPMAPLLTSRGCPYHCVYCNKNIFGHSFRARSPKNVVAEIDWLIQSYGIREIHIMDDNFSFDIKRAEKIFELIANKGYNLTISCQVGLRCDRLTSELILKMKSAGVYRVGIGIESGNEKILKKIRKSLNLDNVKSVCSLLKKARVQTKGFFMFGLPGDTPKSMWETIKFAKEIDPDMAAFSITTPFPDTPLYSYIQKNGRFIEDIESGISSGFFGNRVFYETEETKKEDVLKYFKLAYRSFYLRPKKIFQLLTSMRTIEELKWSMRIIREVPILKFE